MPLVKRNKKKNKLYFKIPACYISQNKRSIKGKFRVRFWDIPESMFEIMMSMIIEYVEKEKCFENLVWDPELSNYKKEIKKLYRFAKAYPKYIKKIEDEYLRKNWSSDPHFFPAIYLAYEEKANALEDQMMQRMIDIRKVLWT